MKKLLFLFSLVAGTASFVQARSIHIPDANFKNVLLTPDQYGFVVDANGDGEISIAEAAAVMILDLNNQNITDLTGIEAFVNLQGLFCDGNQLTTVNLTQNTNLSVLWINSNPLTYLDLSNNPLLSSLQASGLPITDIDLSQNPLLREVEISGNNLSYLDLSNNPNLEALFCGS